MEESSVWNVPKRAPKRRDARAQENRIFASQAPVHNSTPPLFFSSTRQSPS